MTYGVKFSKFNFHLFTVTQIALPVPEEKAMTHHPMEAHCAPPLAIYSMFHP